MDAAQWDKRLAWLDERRLKDTERITKLGERLARLEQALAKQSEQTEELTAAVARHAVLSARIGQVDEALAKHRQEVTKLLKAAEEHRTEKEKQLQQLYRADQKDFARNLAETRKSIDELADLRQLVESRQTEEARLARSLDTVDKKTEGLARQQEEQAGRLAGFQEQGKQDQRVLARLQQIGVEIRAGEESLRAALEITEDRGRRLETKLAELGASEAERNQLQQLWVEQQGRKMVDLERDVREWEKRLAAFDTRAEEAFGRLRGFEETNRTLRTLEGELQSLMERMERRILEIAAMQRLAEERGKQEWTGFQAEDQKRWNTYRVAADEQWREHRRAHERLVGEVASASEGARDAGERLQTLSGQQQKFLSEIVSSMRQWIDEVERATSADS